MSSSPVAVLGECVADAFVTPDAPPGELALRVLPGGGPANTAVALARLGTPTRFLGRLSDDSFGALFRTHLAASGVDLTGCVAAAEPSTLAVATLDDAGRARYSFHAEGAADWAWSPAELTAERVGDVSCLHTGSLALVRAPGADNVEELLAATAARATISIDPNVRAGLVAMAVYRERMPRWCALADIVKLSDDDLEQIHPGEPVGQVCDAWHAAGTRLIVVTRGPLGALVSVDGERTTVPAPPVDVVDTVGAGDSFTAGLLHRLRTRGLLGGRLDSLGLAEAAEAATFAARVAALTCSVAGANPPWARDLAGEPAGEPAGEASRPGV
ncbi:fructokinase [Streptosporangium becharense]|uniref:Fructokinase n=1 Tax=Streptosporangium becharense TaxID=1816182 RepID=A0A7W9IE07_9ACTN|nr:carbohydrate kinase [Streptosporangium becharense]MBB2910090.1 fructokinase [Streptosporangium becharense]MBB5818955.1 fructokinase [Streptosporangium becharense]